MKEHRPSSSIFDDYYLEVTQESQVKSEEEARLSAVQKREESYTALIDAYSDYYKKKSYANITLRKCFLRLSFLLLFVLIGGCISIGILGCIYLEEMFAELISIISSIAGISTTIIVLPRIIGKYLFPPKEDEAIKDLIIHFKDSDDLFKYNKK